MSWYLIPLLFSGLKKDERDYITSAILPHAIPGSSTTKIAFAAMAAKDQARKQAAAEEKIVEEAFKVANITSPANLGANFPALSAAFNKLPAANQKRILDAVAVPQPTAGEREVSFSPVADSSTTPSSARAGRTPPTQPVARTP